MTQNDLDLTFARPVPVGTGEKRREQRLRRFIPYLAHYDGETLLTEDDQLVQIIKLEGLAFQTRDEEELKRQKRFRNRLVTFLYFACDRADERDYRKVFGLSQREFELVREWEPEELWSI